MFEGESELAVTITKIYDITTNFGHLPIILCLNDSFLCYYIVKEDLLWEYMHDFLI